ARLSAELNEKLAHLDAKLARVPDADALAFLQHQITRLEAEIAKEESEHAEAADEIRRADFDLAIRERMLRDVLDRHQDDWEQSEHDRRILERIPKVRETLNAFSVKVVAKHVTALEAAILESFQYLARKDRLVTKISINPATFEVTLIDA